MRATVSATVALWLAPVLAVGLIGLGIPFWGAMAAAALLAAASGMLVGRRLAAAVAPALTGRPLLAAAALLAATAAIVQIARVSVFMVDTSRSSYAAMADPWRAAHCCLTAYAEAARFVESGDVNIYEATLYEPRQLGPLKVDTYHYPPPFLLAPRALRLITDDFFRIRELWFAGQAIVLGAGVAGAALWIGGPAGAYALLGGIAFLAVPTVLFALQMGNFQTTAMVLGLAATLFLLTGRVRRGALLMAYVAASKVFPGILLVYLAAARKWRALAWVAALGIALLLLTLAVFGGRPFMDFLTHELPGISTGSAFPQSERPSVVPANQSIYGLTVRLRLLGVTALDRQTGLQITSIYGLLVIGLAALVGWRRASDVTTTDGRAELVLVALGLLSLASFRSPFVGGGYGLVSTFWTLAILAATARTRTSAVMWALAFTVLATGNRLTPSPAQGNAPTAFWLAASAVSFSIAVGINTWSVARAIRRQPVRRGERAPSPAAVAIES